MASSDEEMADRLDDAGSESSQERPVSYRPGVTDHLPWRPLDVDISAGNMEESGLGMLEVLPAGSYEIVKDDKGTVIIKAKQVAAERKSTVAKAPVKTSDNNKRPSAEGATAQREKKRQRSDAGAAPIAEVDTSKGTGGALGPVQKGGLSVADIWSDWLPLGLHPALLSNIARLGYARPTRVQAAAIPPALAHFKDVIGSAETGQGKTAAYALPILHRLLDRRQRLGMGTVKPGVSIPVLDDEGKSVVGEEIPVPLGMRGWEYKRWATVPALILAPTRELAVQVKDHITALAQGTCISVVCVVGGLNPAKQDRMLRSHPDIIVATPGRLWDMVQSGTHPCLTVQGLASSLQFLVLDEADRLTEKGSFTALTSLLSAMSSHSSSSSSSGQGKGRTGGADEDVPENDPIADRIIAEKRKKAEELRKAMGIRQAEWEGASTDEEADEKQNKGAGKAAQDADEEEGAEGDDMDEDNGSEARSKIDEAHGKKKPGLKGSVPARLLVPTPAHYKRQTLLFSATLGVATAQTAKDAASALVQSQISSGSLAAGSKLSKKAYRKALAKAQTLTPVEALMTRVGILGKPTVVRVKGATAAGAAAAASAPVDEPAVENELMEEESGSDGEEGAGPTKKKKDMKPVKNDEEAETGTDIKSAIPASVALPKGLRLTRITVTEDSRDPALVYFLGRHPGRTLVFVNAINTLRRLSTLLASLHIPVHTLHAHMQQKQRLSHLEAFRREKQGVLVATDVAARGLDIPAVDHVLHYVLPTTAETFVHRCGRTARGEASGLSLALVGPKDQRQYIRLCSVLGMPAGLSEFRVEPRYLKLVTHRVSLARKIAEEKAALDKDAADAGWLAQTAAAAGIVVDDRSLHEVGAGMAELVHGQNRAKEHAEGAQQQGKKRKRDMIEADGEQDYGLEAAGVEMDEEARADASASAKARRKRIQALRAELDTLVAQPVLPTGTSHKYITTNPSLGQAAHPLQAMVKISAQEGSGAFSSAVTSRGSALVAPKVELPQEVMAGLRAAPVKQVDPPGKQTNKQARQQKALSMAGKGHGPGAWGLGVMPGMRQGSSAIAALAAQGPSHAYIPGLSKGKLQTQGKTGLQQRKAGKR